MKKEILSVSSGESWKGVDPNHIVKCYREDKAGKMPLVT